MATETTRSVAERGICFSGDMVRATITCAKCGKISALFPCEYCGSEDFVKGQTRRVATALTNEVGEWPDGVGRCGDGTFIAWWGQCPAGGWQAATEARYPNGGGVRPPYGVPGDLLYVREAFAPLGGYGGQVGPFYAYRADPGHSPSGPWSSGRFMPKRAARTWLEVTGVRVERVQDISRGDCIAEGMGREPVNDYGTGARERDLFAALWDSLNLKRGHGWDANDCVWVYSFKRTEKPK